MIYFNLIKLIFLNYFPHGSIGLTHFRFWKEFLNCLRLVDFNFKNNILGHNREETSKGINKELINLIDFFYIVEVSILKRANLIHCRSIVIRAKAKRMDCKAFIWKISINAIANLILSSAILSIWKEKNWTDWILSCSIS